LKQTTNFRADVREDLAAVVGALARGSSRRTTQELAGELGLQLGRVRGALQLLRAAGVVAFDARWQETRDQGYSRVWRFVGAGAVNLWEPILAGRRRRLYVDRATAIDSARRTMGPEAAARSVVFRVSEKGRVG